MLRDLLKKELLEKLISLRLVLTFLLVVTLMLGNALLFESDYQRLSSDYHRDVNRNLAELAKTAASSMPLFGTFSWSTQFLYRQPNFRGFISEGHDRDLPNAIQANGFKLGPPEYTLRGNPLLWQFDTLDWAFVVSIILSFAAVILAYDSISGERESGTLRLLLSQSVPREKVLIGKYLAVISVLAVPLVVGVLLNLLVLGLRGVVVWDVEFILRTTVCLIFCLICISTFALIGLFLSTRTRESVVSLVTALLVWVVLVLVIPAVGNLLARGLIKVPQQDQVQEEAQRAFSETIRNYNRSHPHPDNWIASGSWSPGEPLLRAFEANQARSRILQDYQERLLEQVTLGRRIAAISPAALSSQSLEIAVESGIPHYGRFLERARRYREALGEFLDRIYPLDKAYPLDRSKTDRVLQDMKLGFDTIPKFEDRFASMRESGSQLVWNGGILLALNFLLFVAAYISFLRYDVR